MTLQRFDNSYNFGKNESASILVQNPFIEGTAAFQEEQEILRRYFGVHGNTCGRVPRGTV